jgi:hypothetical protein
MRREVHYCQKWSRGYKQRLSPLTEAQASEAHRSGKLYTAVIGVPDRPAVFIEVVGENNYVGVGFLDDELRDFLAYSFQRIDDGRLFLSMASFREYVGRSDQVAAAQLYLFNISGSVEVQETDILKDIRRTGTRKLDIAANFEAWPNFGQYDHLTHRSRPNPLD